MNPEGTGRDASTAHMTSLKKKISHVSLIYTPIWKRIFRNCEKIPNCLK